MTTADTDAALLWTVLESPANDGPRLVLADWLEETGGEDLCHECAGIGRYHPKCPLCRGSRRATNGRRERAEFIRCQVELAKVNPRLCRQGECQQAGYGLCHYCRGIESLKHRERELSHGITDVWPWSFGQPGDPGIGTVYRRGFVESVELTCAAFVGHSCPLCYGRPWQPNVVHAHCPECSSTGRVGGLAQSLFLAAPITRVVLSDKRPIDGTGWIRATEASYRQGRLFRPMRLTDAQIEAAVLPSQLFLLLPKVDDSHGWIDCRPDGLSALSATAVALGRQWAGLPPLPTS